MAKTSVDGTEGVEAKEVVKPVSGATMKKIFAVQNAAAEDRKKINEDVHDKIADLVGDRALDKLVAGFLRKLHNIKNERLAYHYDNLMYGLEATGIEARAKKIARLPLEESDAAPGNVEDLSQRRAAVN